jgi:hypothetical protein
VTAPDDAQVPAVVYPDLEPFRVGTVLRFGQPPIACYDLTRVLARYVEDGMTEEDAEEFFHYNTLGTWAGDETPCFLWRSGADDGDR